MKKIIEDLTLDIYQSKTFNMYFGGKSFAVFDIETTGLVPKYSKLILSGILLNNGNDFQAIQLFAGDPDDEKEIVEETIRILSTVDYVITYNGKHFDMPFLIKRAEKYNLDVSSLPYNLDIFLVVNGHSSLKEVLPNLKQKTIEMFMGVSNSRDDEISGGDSVELYNRYMSTHSIDLERQILLHNHDDIILLYQILPVIDKCDFHKAMFKLGFLAGDFQINTVRVKGHDLYVSGKQLNQPKDYISFPSVEEPYSLIMDSLSRDMELIIPGQCEAGAIYFDAKAILGIDVSKIEKYPSVTNGYLVISNNSQINHCEINDFLLNFFNKLT